MGLLMFQIVFLIMNCFYPERGDTEDPDNGPHTSLDTIEERAMLA
jgi:hypothetical protein